MDRQQEIQESFNDFYQSFFPAEGQPMAFLSSVSSATEKANQCVSKAKSVTEENSFVASEYYCLGSFVCLVYMLNNGMVDSLYQKGNELAKKAAELLPEDSEYLLSIYFIALLP